MVNDREIVSSPFEIESLIHASTHCILLIDAGGVLFNNVTEDSAFIGMIASKFGVDAKSLRHLYTSGDSCFETNKVSVRDFIEKCLMELGADALDDEALKAIDDIYVDSVVPDKEMFLVLRRLRSIGRKLVLVNNEGERWEKLKHRHFGHLDLFDTIASSWKLRVCKPERAYFSRLQRVLRPIPKERWWLIDDNAENVAAARANGIAASRYSKSCLVTRAP